MSQWLSPGHFPPPQPPYSTFQGPPPVPSNQYLPSYQRPSLPPPSQAPSLDDLSLAFDNLAMALRLTAGPQEIDDFQVTLGMLMHDCSQSNIQRGKTWIFNHCSSPTHYEVLLRFLIALSRSRTVFEDKLHLIYLVNDVLFHSERRQEPWIKEALHPNLLALLRSAFHFIDANEKQQEKVLKIISIWGDKHYFDDAKINALKSGVMVPPPPPGGPPSVTFPGIAPPGHPAFGHIRYQNPQNVSPFYNQGAPPPPNIFPGAHSPAQSIISSSTHLSPPIAHGHLRPNSEPAPPGIPSQFPSGPSPPDMTMQGIAPRPNVSVTPPIPAVPEKKYYELPAGLMVPAVSPEDPPYTPIHASSIRLPPHRLPPTPELLEAVDKFYEGMKLIELTIEEDDENATPENNNNDNNNNNIIIINDNNNDDNNIIINNNNNNTNNNNNNSNNNDKNNLDKDGWENGFLDDYYKDLQIRRAAAAARAAAGRYYHRPSYRRKRDDRGRRWSRDRSYSRSRSRSWSSSKSYSRSRRRRYSYSDSSGSSRSRSRGRKRHRRNSRSHTRSRSSSRRRYKSHSRTRHDWRRAKSGTLRTRTRSRSRSRSLLRSRSYSRSRSRSRTRSKSVTRIKTSSKSKVMTGSRSKTGRKSRSRSSIRGRTRSRSRSISSSRSRSTSRSRSRSYERSRSRSYSRDRGRLKSSEFGSTSRKRYQSRSHSKSRSRTPTFNGGGIGYVVKEREEGARPDKMISDHNVGFQMLKKLGWEGAGTGLGLSTPGITEPIKGGEIRLGEQKYLGVGHNQGDEDDIFDQYRKAKSYTYQRSDVNSKDKKPAGCFRCGKPGHIARECPD